VLIQRNGNITHSIQQNFRIFSEIYSQRIHDKNVLACAARAKRSRVGDAVFDTRRVTLSKIVTLYEMEFRIGSE